MMGIRISMFAMMIFTTLSCEDRDVLGGLEDARYIRFFLLVNPNNEALEYPEWDANSPTIDIYNKNDVLPLKIPVALTDQHIQDEIRATFSVQITGDIALDSIPRQLSFEPGRLVDTIFVTIHEPWDTLQTQRLILTLLETTDPGIEIGAPNSIQPGDRLTVNFKPPAFQYGFSTNRSEISGQQGEELFFDLVLPKGYFASDIEDDQIFDVTSDFAFEMVRAYTSETSITYKVTLLEDLQNDFMSFISTIALKEFNGYTPSGTTVFQIVKPVQVVRDVATNPAAHFYNLSDNFHRTYGENWGDFNEDGECDWASWFAFTYPVEVKAGDKNAIRHDRGTADPSDDVYYHAFKIGFGNKIRQDLTTNAFNLKRWFTGESNASGISPGFNMNPALEFFPSDGTSLTSGTVLVEAQVIKIGTSSNNDYNIAMDGRGTYRQIEEGLFEIELVLEATSQALFGGTITSEYKLYNSNTYPSPSPIQNDNCITPIDL